MVTRLPRTNGTVTHRVGHKEPPNTNFPGVNGRQSAHANPFDGLSTRIFCPTEWDWLSDQLHLSPRELDVVRHIFRGHSEARAAFLLNLSTDTVHTYVRRAYAKLGVHDQKELILHIVRLYLDHFVRRDYPQPNGTELTAENAERREPIKP